MAAASTKKEPPQPQPQPQIANCEFKFLIRSSFCFIIPPWNRPQPASSSPSRLPALRTETDAQGPATRAYILEAATNIFATFNPSRVTLRAFAEACGLSPSTVRRHVCDMHHLLVLVLAAHLDRLLDAIGQIPDRPDRHARARAEYHRLTRDQDNRPVPLHAAFVRHRFALPEDEFAPLEKHRRMLGAVLAGADGELALDLLDGGAPLSRIEAMLAADPTRMTADPPPRTAEKAAETVEAGRVAEAVRPRFALNEARRWPRRASIAPARNRPHARGLWRAAPVKTEILGAPSPPPGGPATIPRPVTPDLMTP